MDNLFDNNKKKDENNKKKQENKDKKDEYLIQGSLFRDIKEEKIYLNKFENNNEKKENNEQNKDQTQEQKPNIKIYHRKNFGIIEKNIYLNLDQGRESKSEACPPRCRRGTWLVFLGFNYWTKTLSGGRIINLPEIPESLLDLLNEIEIYQMFIATYKGKWNRDLEEGKIGNPNAYAAQIISYHNLAHKDIEETLADLITQGEYYLRDHWKFNEIISNKKSNPYEYNYQSLLQRLKMIPELDKLKIKEILVAKKVPFSRKEEGYGPGITSYEYSQMHNKNKDKTRVYKKDLHKKELEKIGFFIDKWKCASEIFDYFKKREELYFPWHNNVEII